MLVYENMKLNLRILKLVKKLETEPGFVREEDERALYKVLNEQNLAYVWNDEIFNPEIIIFQKTKRNLGNIPMLKGLTSKKDSLDQRKEEGWKSDTWGVRK